MGAAILPTCCGGCTASEWGTAAKALYACLISVGNSSGEGGVGARGCGVGVGRRGEKRAGGSEGEGGQPDQGQD